MSKAVTQADAMAQRGDVEGAVRLLGEAEKAGDGLAARELAAWHLGGQLVPRDLAVARALFERAAALGDEISAPVATAFIAAGVGGAASWGRAVELLRGASDPASAAQLRVIEQMELSEDGQPAGKYEGEVLSDRPHVQMFHSLFTPAECAYLIEAATPVLQPSGVIDPRTGTPISNPVRTSDAAAFPFVAENPAIHALNRRLAKASGTPTANGEPLQVLRYAGGQEYRPHFDAIGTEANQRVLTFLVYLNDDYEGGETHFLANRLSVKGRTGDGLLFRNADENGRADPASQHAGLPVTKGVKFLASRWIRQRPMVG